MFKIAGKQKNPGSGKSVSFILQSKPYVLPECCQSLGNFSLVVLPEVVSVKIETLLPCHVS